MQKYHLATLSRTPLLFLDKQLFRFRSPVGQKLVFLLRLLRSQLIMIFFTSPPTVYPFVFRAPFFAADILDRLKQQ
jgi:hypothetical protein